MTPSKALQEAMNLQIQKEFASAYAYLQMAAHCEHANLPGFAAWLREQAREEAGHAMKIYTHLLDRGAEVTLLAVEAPHARFASALDVFERALEHERQVTASIDRLYGLALQEKDYAAQVFLEWFVSEQVEEEKTVTQVVESLRMIGDNRPALLVLDREMARRGASAPATA